MAKLLVVFNHTLTESQRQDACSNLSVTDIVMPPDNVSRIWSEIPPEPECIKQWLQPLFDWLEENASTGDYALVQGEFGATCLTVRFAIGLGLKPVYSTTKRKAFEEVLINNEVKISHCFKHVRFRLYEV